VPCLREAHITRREKRSGLDSQGVLEIIATKRGYG